MVYAYVAADLCFFTVHITANWFSTVQITNYTNILGNNFVLISCIICTILSAVG